MKHLTYLTFLLASTSEVAAEVTIPNTFVSGTPAVASDVNANFSTMADGINVNDTNIGINATNIDTNSTAITALQSATSGTIRVLDGNGADAGSILNHHGKYITLITNTGYVVPYLFFVDGRIFDALSNWIYYYYESDNCTGTPYTNELSNGIVFMGYGMELSYIDKQDTGSTLTTNSVFVSGGCNKSGAPTLLDNLFEVKSNASAITGFTDAANRLPFTIQ